MKEHPIIFSDDMVRAILDGRKTQTRRVVSIRNTDYYEDKHTNHNHEIVSANNKFGGLFWSFGLSWEVMRIQQHDVATIPCPCGQVGDRLWVREKIIRHKEPNDMPDTITYSSDLTPVIGKKPPRLYLRRAVWLWGKRRVLPSIFMPRWASRITLEVTGIRVERVQDISEADAIAEGIERINNPFSFHWCWKDYTGNNQSLSPVFSYISLWDSINAKRGYSWDKNPWVWVIEFRKVDIHG